MIKKFTGLLVAAAVMSIAPLFAEEPGTAKAGGGTLMVQDKSYPLTHVLAYETMMDDAERIVVVLSSSTISAEKLKEARAEEKDGRAASFNRPYLKLEFTKTRELSRWSAGAGPSFMNKGPSGVSAELKAKDGRVTGKASQPNETEGNFRSGFDVHFDVALVRLKEALPPKKKPGPAANVKPTVTGLFKGNGKEAKIAYVSAHWREPFSGKPGMVLVFTEKDHSKDPKPDFNGAFGKFDSALIISVFEDGDVFGCQVVHSAHKKQGFSSTGRIKTNDFKFEDGKVEGELTTEGEDDTFGEKWEVNLKFLAPLGEIPKEFQVPDSKKSEDTATDKPKKETAETDSDDDTENPTSKPAKDQLKIKDLALTKGATDVEYKAAIEHVIFKSKSNPKAVCAELTVNLKAQGWTNDGSDLITPASSILKRKRGGASLTIFVKPEGGGSQVQIFTEGLSWEGS
ncbi:MAG: hypothetical protein M3N12_05840 [Verrucomicrobiota bacterium]|nr:hypothetical protein [Verrucomicrobiota bacterium]